MNFEKGENGSPWPKLKGLDKQKIIYRLKSYTFCLLINIIFSVCACVRE
jgi:hypothetical protein